MIAKWDLLTIRPVLAMLMPRKPFAAAKMLTGAGKPAHDARHSRSHHGGVDRRLIYFTPTQPGRFAHANRGMGKLKAFPRRVIHNLRGNMTSELSSKSRWTIEPKVERVDPPPQSARCWNVTPFARRAASRMTADLAGFMRVRRHSRRCP
jgi:hypothetical protein